MKSYNNLALILKTIQCPIWICVSLPSKAMPAQMRLLALRLADGLAEAAQQRQILLPEAGMQNRKQTMVSPWYLLHGDQLMTAWFT